MDKRERENTMFVGIGITMMLVGVIISLFPYSPFEVFYVNIFVIIIGGGLALLGAFDSVKHAEKLQKEELPVPDDIVKRYDEIRQFLVETDEIIEDFVSGIKNAAIEPKIKQ